VRRVYGFRQRGGVIWPDALPPQPHILLATTPLSSAVAAAASTEGHHAPTPAGKTRATVHLSRKAARSRGRPELRAVRDGRLLCRKARRDVLRGAQRAELRDERGVRVAKREAT